MSHIARLRIPLQPKMFCAKFGWNWPSGSGDEDFKLRKSIFTILWLSHAPSFEHIWIPFTQGCFVPSLVEIDPVVVEKKTKKWKVYNNHESSVTGDLKKMSEDTIIFWLLYLETTLKGWSFIKKKNGQMNLLVNTPLSLIPWCFIPYCYMLLISPFAGFQIGVGHRPFADNNSKWPKKIS